MLKNRSKMGGLWIALWLITLLSGFGCDENAIAPGRQVDYRLEGLLVVDPNLESTLVSRSFKTALRYTQGGIIPDSGEVTLDGSPLVFYTRRYDVDSLYLVANNATYEYTNASLNIGLTDGGSFGDTIAVSVPDSFSIVNISPTNHLLQGLDPVSLEWTGSNRAETYVMAAVLIDSAYTGYGYSLYAAEQATSGTIPPQAFGLSDGLTPDTGLYVLYVYAITGAPDVMLADALLPVPLPSQLPDNIAESDLTGRFGSIVVTKLDTIRVVEQP